MEAKIILTLNQKHLEKIMKENNLTTAAELRGFLKAGDAFNYLKDRYGDECDISIETKNERHDYLSALQYSLYSDLIKRAAFLGIDFAKPEVKEVKRKAKVGEWIKIVEPFFTAGCYKTGDILKVCCVDNNRGVYTERNPGFYISNKEYVVLENYEPPKKPEVKEVKRRAKVGEWIKIVNAHCTWGCYVNGDILKVDSIKLWGTLGVHVTKKVCPYIADDEYVVLENYVPPKKPEVKEVKRQAKVGEYIKIVYDKQGNCNGEQCYHTGDILKVYKEYDVFNESLAGCVFCQLKYKLKMPDGTMKNSYVIDNGNLIIYPSEYVVLENYDPEDGEDK